MVKQIAKFFFHQLPVNVQKEMLFKKDTFYKDQIIQKWEQQGKPVPPPHIIKQQTISGYQQQYGYDTLIETGTYLGHMLDRQRTNFSALYSIELSPDFWAYNVKKFRKHPHIQILQGDSGVLLQTLTQKLTQSAIFWLDGHYSSGTAKGDLECPIYAELNAVFDCSVKQHVVLIDDARDFTGANDYPTIDEIRKFVADRGVKHTFEVKDDIIRIVLL